MFRAVIGDLVTFNRGIDNGMLLERFTDRDGKEGKES